LLNTFAHPPEGQLRLPLPLRLFRVPGLGELLVKGLHLVARAFLFGGGTMRHDRLTHTVRRAFLAPHPTFASRAGVLALARQYPGLSLRPRVAEGRPLRRSGPPWTAGGRNDRGRGKATLDRWRRECPHAEIDELPGAGHFVHLDAPERIVPRLLAFLSKEKR